MKTIFLLPVAFALLFAGTVSSQTIYFADGQHGGVYGHYPLYVTQFLVEQLNQHPDWKINLEIEPPTWDVVESNTPDIYKAFKSLFADQSTAGRLEYVNPQYGQSFLWDITGESIIRQYDYGTRTVKQHFPNAVFTTYSSEEPMFTSALPQILKSFGIQYAVLKNPNTCWGGYIRAFGGELVNWVGPDGTAITTVPRYATESLLPNSTWQTTAWNDSQVYIDSAFNAGIQHPIGMCYQDAGWRNGPWIGSDGTKSGHPMKYEIWRNYFETVATSAPTQDWHFSQEDVLVSLVWGSQVLQHVAQDVRSAENKIIIAEKLAALAKIYEGTAWPQSEFNEAWPPLLLSEHHDCWIVPYNLKDGSTWAAHVAAWTGSTKGQSESIIGKSVNALAASSDKSGQKYIRVFNTLGIQRTAMASVALPDDWAGAKILDGKNQKVSSQIILNPDTDAKEILFEADVPALGYNTYRLDKGSATVSAGASVAVQADGTYQLETDLYQLILNPAQGGTIKSLIAKRPNEKEFVDEANARKFDEIRGNFYRDGGFHSSADQPAHITVLENGPLQVRVKISGMVDSNPFTQFITLNQGQRRIDFQLKIDWQGNPGIGSDYAQNERWQSTDYKKAFYNDRDKLSALFPLNLKSQEVYKNAPFDVTQSKLKDTFFTRWDDIKNNVLLNWVDVVDGSHQYGLALFTDHTTSYAHGEDFPLGLTLQYSGMGLWGRNYRINGPTEISYALVPHSGLWDSAQIWTASDDWDQPLIGTITDAKPDSSDAQKSLIDVSETGLEVSSATFQGRDLLVRIFNAEGTAVTKIVFYGGQADAVQLVELDGKVVRTLKMEKTKSGQNFISLALPRFGIRTIKFCNAK